MNSLINYLSDLISSSKDRRLNKQLLSIQKKVEKIQIKETKKIEKGDLKRRKESQNIIKEHFKSKGNWTREANKRAVDQLDLEVRLDDGDTRKFRIENMSRQKTIEKFLSKVRKKVLRKIGEMPSSKVRYILSVTMQKVEKELGKKRAKRVTSDRHFRVPYDVVQNDEDRASQFNSLLESFSLQLENCENRDSGWSLKSIDRLDIEQIIYSKG